MFSMALALLTYRVAAWELSVWAFKEVMETAQPGPEVKVDSAPSYMGAQATRAAQAACSLEVPEPKLPDTVLSLFPAAARTLSPQSSMAMLP